MNRDPGVTRRAATLVSIAVIATAFLVGLTSPAGAQTPSRHRLSSSAADSRPAEHALRAAPTTSARTLVLLVAVLPGRGTEEALCSLVLASRPAYAGGDPVNGSDPSGAMESGPDGQLCEGDGACNTGATGWDLGGGRFLPDSGSFPYQPPKGSDGPQKIRGRPSWRDERGNEWDWDPRKSEWDVQHPDGSHTNVGPDGETTHGPNNFPNLPRSSSAPDGSSGSGNSNSAATAVGVAGAGAGAGIVLWWVLKPAAVACGPFAPLCAFAF